MGAKNIDTEPEVFSQEEMTTALTQITKGEVDMQVATAKRYPRDVTRFKQDALSMATSDRETAEACYYVLRRSGKTIEGPGVRLAEIIASCWGNLRCEARIIDEGDEFITAQGTCWDMERNFLVRMETRRRITDKTGRRYTEDMRVVTGNAAASIAFRNAVFKVIPNAFTNAIYEKARKVAVGSERTLADRRDRAIAWFDKAGVTLDRLLAFLGRQGVDGIDLNDLVTLQGVRTAILEGTTTVDQQFAQTAPPVEKEGPQPGVHKVGRNKQKADAQPQPEAEPKAEPEAKPAPEAKEEPAKTAATEAEETKPDKTQGELDW